MWTSGRSDERGVALILTLLLAFMVAGIAVGMILMTGNGTLISKFHTTEAVMEASADGGIEQGRDTLNGTLGIVPPTGGFDTLELNSPVRDASGLVIPGFTRSVYAGRSGNISGQFGSYASVISVIQNPRGAVVVRRGELAQESFAKFARFDNLTNSSIRFASGIQVWGPLHTNQTLYVDASGGRPTFHGPVTTASTISTVGAGIFEKGYKQNVAVIPMPTPAALATLSAYATAGNAWLAGGTVGTTVFNPNTRIEFVPVDINRDGDFSDENEGFFRVFRATGTTSQHLAYVSARRWPGATSTTNDPNLESPNCGGIWTGAQGATPADSGKWKTAGFVYATRSGTATAKRTAVQGVLASTSGARRCYLGGDVRLYPGYYSTPSPAPFFVASDAYGAWQPWPGWAGGANAAVSGGRLQDGRTVGDAMAIHLWPATREFNLNFKGVIYVEGSVAISGQLRGRVTVAATGNMMLADDLTYVTPPGNDPDCQADILGLLTPQFFMLEDNSVNAPFRVNGAYVTGFDESADESLQGAVLTLQSIQSEDVGNGSASSHTCVGVFIGRGCFLMLGSAIQQINGSRMSGETSTTNTGWNPQWSYDRCMAVAPPPYFPTTGRYYMNRHYEIDPVGFDPALWFTENQSGI